MGTFSSGNFYDDNDDLKFYVEKYIDWETLVRHTEFDFRAKDCFENLEEALDVYRGIIDMLGEFAANEIAPNSARIDREHPYLKNGVVHFPEVLDTVFKKIKELEVHGMCLPRSLGGMNCPVLLFMLTNELLARADVSVTAHHGFHGGMAMAMLFFSVIEGTTEFDSANYDIGRTRFRKEIQDIIAGEAWASMDITEPGAGSDMAALSTTASQDADGVWRVTGQKIFITSGHARYHFVIARTEETRGGDDAFSGLKGLSMFLVPAYEFDKEGNRIELAQFVSLEDKLGHHGSATVTIAFDKTPAELIGKRGEGFKYMLMLMNNARIGVGFEAIGISEAALRMAKAYAAERESMGKTIDRHEMIADYLDEMQTDIHGLRALAVKSAYHEEMAQKINAKLQFDSPEDESEAETLQGEKKYHQFSARMLTPLLKYLGAEKAVEITRRCVQIHGGYGYSSEYGAEKLLRDAMVLPIYEGTSQMQALMVMKDNLMDIIRNPRRFLARSGRARFRSRAAKSSLERDVALLQVRSCQALEFLVTRMVGKKLMEMRKRPIGEWKDVVTHWNPKKDFSLAMLHAERLTRILADTAVVKELYRQAKMFPERTEILEGYLERAKPRSKHLLTEITTTGNRLLNQLNETTEIQLKKKLG